jgi:hypothetical protein
LYIFAGDQPLCAQLSPANQDAAVGSFEEAGASSRTAIALARR